MNSARTLALPRISRYNKSVVQVDECTLFSCSGDFPLETSPTSVVPKLIVEQDNFHGKHHGAVQARWWIKIVYGHEGPEGKDCSLGYRDNNS